MSNLWHLSTNVAATRNRTTVLLHEKFGNLPIFMSKDCARGIGPIEADLSRTFQFQSYKAKRDVREATIDEEMNFLFRTSVGFVYEIKLLF